jgi:hypothetical protein
MTLHAGHTRNLSFPPLHCGLPKSNPPLIFPLAQPLVLSGHLPLLSPRPSDQCFLLSTSVPPYLST